MPFLSIILIIGVLTTFTDLKSKKISNQHLMIGAVLGLIVTAYAAIFRHEQVLFHIVNALVAFLIGLFMYHFDLWRGGDAKLFTLYAFLMPTPVYSHLLFPTVVSLFACSFIAGTIILIPVLIKDFIINHNAIANNLLLPAKRQALFKGIIKIIYFSWILFPCYYLARQYLARIPNSVIILTLMSFFFSGRVQKAKKHYIIGFFKENFILLSIGFIFGFLIRLWFSPNSLSYPALTRYIIMITLTATISTCMYTIFSCFKDYHERVPFAPLLLTGCVLSYTPFLTWVIHFTHFIRR